MSDFTKSHENLKKKCEAEDLDVIYPTEYELQLDIDNDNDFNTFKELFPIFQKKFRVISVDWHHSKSSKPERWHVDIKIERSMTIWERICLQACLGSDRKRELLSFICAENGDQLPTLFLERKK